MMKLWAPGPKKGECEGAKPPHKKIRGVWGAEPPQQRTEEPREGTERPSANFIIVFFSCFLYSGFTLGLRKKPNIDPFVLMFFFSITAFIASFPGILIENHLNLINWPNNKNDFLIIIYIALVPSLIAQLFFIRGVELIGADKASLFINLVPVFSAFLGIIILNEKLQFFHLVSLIVILFGIYLFMVLGENYKKRKKI